jgi:hypothetical protein
MLVIAVQPETLRVSWTRSVHAKLAEPGSGRK